MTTPTGSRASRTRTTNPNGQTVTYTYNALNLPTQAAYSNGTVTTLTYDSPRRRLFEIWHNTGGRPRPRWRTTNTATTPPAT